MDAILLDDLCQNFCQKRKKNCFSYQQLSKNVKLSILAQVTVKIRTLVISFCDEKNCYCDLRYYLISDKYNTFKHHSLLRHFYLQCALDFCASLILFQLCAINCITSICTILVMFTHKSLKAFIFYVFC